MHYKLMIADSCNTQMNRKMFGADYGIELLLIFKPAWVLEN